MNTKDMTVTALMAALLCVVGPLSIAIGPIPLSLATFAVYLCGAVLGKKRGTVAVALYLLIGSMGVPVFSAFSGGFSRLIGVTGGYLIGYLPCAWCSGLGCSEAGRKWRLPACMALGTLVLYSIGTAWFMLQTRNSLLTALGLCVLPFLPGDAIKIAGACMLTRPVQRALQHMS